MPPLATVGFGLATWNWPVFAGALLLFVTNFVTIALTAAVMARAYGFGQKLSPNQTVLQLVIVFATVAALAVPLGLSLRQLAWEGLASSAARTAIRDVFTANARISQIEIDYARQPIDVNATVLTPRYHADAERIATAALVERLGRPVHVVIQQYRVGMGEAEAAAIQTAQPRAGTASVDAAATAVANRVATIAGVDRAAVLVDRVARRVRAEARQLPGATLGTYRALEGGAAVDGWTIELIPPPIAPEALSFAAEAYDPVALADVVWGARRRGLALSVAGSTRQADAVIAALTAQGVAATRAPGTGAAGGVGLAWTLPETTPPAPPR